MPRRMKTVTLDLLKNNLKRLENQLLRDEGDPATTEQAVKHAVRHYPGLQNEVKNLKAEIYDLRAKLKEIGKNRETIETACQEIDTAVHEALSWDYDSRGFGGEVEDEEGAEDCI